jgi:hypothetical protein
MNPKIFAGIMLGIFLVTSACLGTSMADDIPRVMNVASEYSDEVLKSSPYIDDLLKDILSLQDEAARATQAGNLDDAVKNFGSASAKADELGTYVANLNQRRPRDLQLADETLKLLAYYDDVYRYTSLVNQEQRILTTTAYQIEAASGKHFSVLEQAAVEISLKNIVCLNLELIVSEGRFANPEDYQLLFIKSFFTGLLPVNVSKLLEYAEKLHGFADEIAKGTSANEILYKQRFLQACNTN